MSPRDSRVRFSFPSILLAIVISTLGIAHAGLTVAAPLTLQHEYDRTADGEWAVAGASWHDGYRGAAHVYRRAGRSWVLEAELAPPERGPFARFGRSVAINGNTLVIGAPWDDGWHGAAYIYERSAGSWRLTSRLAPDGAVGDRFGSRVSIADGVVSLATEDGTVARFERTESGWAEVERAPVGSATLAPGRAVAQSLVKVVTDFDAQSGISNIIEQATIDAPEFVTATDSLYEDRTEIRWKPVVDTGAFLYKIYRRVNGGPQPNALIRVASQDDSLFSDVTGTPGVEYVYCITVVDMAGVESATIRCDLGSRIIFQPRDFTASDATFEGLVRLRWSDLSRFEAGYRILRNSNLLHETDLNAEAYDDSTAAPDTVYTYDLIAFDAANNTTAALTDTGRSAFIAAPLGVSASDGQYTDKVVITWEDQTELEANYRVYRVLAGSASTPDLIATRPADSTSYEDPSAVFGTIYEYCVAAVDSGGQESARGCDNGGIGILAAVADVQATDGTFDDKVEITWRDTSDTEDGFLVYRKLVGASDSVLVGNLVAGNTQLDDLGGEADSIYSYCVVAFSNSGGRSISVCDDGQRAIVIAPESVRASDGTFEDRVDIVWESSSTTAVLFKIYRGADFIRSVSGDRRSYSDEDLPSGVKKAYAVGAVTALGVESPAAVDTGFRAIAAPASVKATDDQFEDRVELSWTDQSGIESGFFVSRRLAGTTDPLVRVATRPANRSTYVDRSGAPGETYDYFVTAFHAYGPGRADTTESDPGENTGSRALVPPTFVEASDGAFEDRVEVSWVDECRFEEAYHVWRKNTVLNDSSRVAVLPPNSNAYVDLGITFGAAYEYSVFAADSAGGALLGTSAAGKDEGSTAILPPASVSASDLYLDKVVVTWIDESAMEDGYEISREDIGVIGSTLPNVTTFTDNSAVAGDPNIYCVRSISAADSSQLACDEGTRFFIDAGGPPVQFAGRFTGTSSTPADSFGFSIDGTGQAGFNFLLVGAPHEIFGTSGAPRGVVKVFDESFSQNNLILNFDPQPSDRFGLHVAVSGSWSMVSSQRMSLFDMELSPIVSFKQNGIQKQNVTAHGVVAVDIDGTSAIVVRGLFPNDPPPASFGGADFYTLTGGSWGYQNTWGNRLRSAAIDDTTAVIGSNGDLVWVLGQDVLGVKGPALDWVTRATLRNTALPGFGESVDIDGDWIVVGRPTSPSGEAFVYHRDGNGTWQQQAFLEPSRMEPSFGSSVSIRGGTIMVGAPGDEAVYAFFLQDEVWVRRELLPSPGPAISGRGTSVKVFDGFIVSGAPGTGLNAGVVERSNLPLAPPGIVAPSEVSATDAVHRDKVQVTWSDDNNNEAGYKVYRDGVLIETTDPNFRAYADQDAEPGRTYEYCVTTFLDDSTESLPTCDFGRRPPDGNITGRVSTRSGAGVSFVEVCLDPTPNRALLFDGLGGTMTVADGGVFGDAFTVEFWYRGFAMAGQKFMQYSTASTPDAFAVNAGDVGFPMQVVVNGGAHLLTPNVNDGAWHHVAIDWTSSSGKLNGHIDGQLVLAASSVELGYDFESDGTLVFGKALTGAMDDIRVWDHVRTQAQIQKSMNLFLTGAEAGLTAYWPLNQFQGLGAEELVGDRYGVLSEGAHWAVEAAPLVACAESGTEGNYVLPNLRYGASTTFKVVPTMTGHQFEPAFKAITLATESPVQNEVGFNDITSFTVSGVVTYRNTECSAANIEIYVNDVLRGLTDGDGRYAVPATPGPNTIEAQLSGHTFSPSTITLANVTSDVAGQDFVDLTERRLSGVVGGGCNIPIGTLKIVLESEDRCFSKTIETSSGIDEVLPPLKYFLRVADVTGLGGGPDEAVVLQFFDNIGSREVDLSESDQVLDFKYRAPLRVTIDGLPDPPNQPNCAITVPVIAQQSRYPLTIRVDEDYGNGNLCPVDTGTVTLFDEIIDEQDNPVTLVVRAGQAFVKVDDNTFEQYETAANTPNIFAGRVDAQGNDRSYQKSLTVVADVEGQEPVTKTIWTIVTGHRPRTPSFTSESQGIPLLILRDPPGDRSFSFVQEDSTFCTKFSDIKTIGASLGFEQKAQLGIDFEAGFGIMVKTKAETFIEGGLEIGFEKGFGNEFTTCVKTTEEFRTSADDLFVGRDGDVYVGLALNVIFAKTDVVRVNGCNIETSEEITLGIDDVETVYSFTDWHIRNSIIPSWEDIAEDDGPPGPGPPTGARLRADQAIANWEQHLVMNQTMKDTAATQRNRSFSAGADFNYSASVDTSTSRVWSSKVYTNANLALGFDFKTAIGGQFARFFATVQLAFETSGNTTISTTRTTGYTLSDDDIGDFFSVDVKHDPVYGTPIFDLVSGTSSCPWEAWPDPENGDARSQPVDRAVMTVQPPILRKVPPESKALFTLNVTNDSEAEQLREYLVIPIHTTNPGGADLKIDGAGFGGGISVFLDPGETRQLALAVGRGPNWSFYRDIKILMVPPCEYALFRAGGPLRLADTVSITVEFDAPCSDITLLRPQPGWAVGASEDTLDVLLTDFELAISEEDSLASVGVQFQLEGTDFWTTIGSEITRSMLTVREDGSPESVRLKWPIANREDGVYTLRAFTRCGVPVSGPRNFSSMATGVIDRTPPVVFGTPQPSDGLLSLGEDISITFDENVGCASGNVSVEVIGGLPQQAVDVSVACNGRTLVITPTGPTLDALESAVLRARVENLEDAQGNPIVAPVSWEFTVQRSGVAWTETSLLVDAPFGQEALVRSSLTNGTDADIDFTIEDVAPWLTPSIVADSVRAGETAEIEFTVADDRMLGTHIDTLNAVVRDGGTVIQTLPLVIRVDVICVRPALAIDPSDFENTMTFVSRVNIDGATSADRNDILAAYVGNQLRGVAQPDSIALGEWLYFLTVYSNRLAGETIRFQVWDDDACILYTATDEAAVFEADNRLGSLATPFTLDTRISAPCDPQLVPVDEGWTWISLNRKPALGLVTNLVLGDLNPSAGDLIKAQLGQFSTFDPSLGWEGTLDTLNNASGYLISLSEAGTIILDGCPAFPSLTPIDFGTGWNWIGYVPQAASSTDDALVNFTPLAESGDVIKSQLEFAQYDGSSWIGSLDTMEPGRGYKLYTTASDGSFQYPLVAPPPLASRAAAKRAPVAARSAPGRAGSIVVTPETGPGWELNPRAYQYNMTITAELVLEEGAAAPDGFQVAALVNDQVRGIAQVKYVAGLGKHMVFLMVYSNALQGETLSFQIYDVNQNAVQQVVETLTFEADRIAGSLADPVSLSGGQVQLVGAAPFSLSPSYPNPVRSGAATHINYTLPLETHVELELFDIAGRLVRTLVSSVQPAGLHEVTVASGSLEAGTYFYRMKAGPAVRVERMIVLR